ncbi:MAG: WD40 repeat domain-containing protein, partial [Gemmataceae bacterium]
MHSARLLMASLLIIGFLSAASADDPKDVSAPTDGDGNPLPRGAVARLGSTRWRLRHELRGVILSPDGRTLAVSTSEATTELVDAKTGKRLQGFGAPTWSGIFGPRLPAAFAPDGSAIAHLEASEDHQILRIRRLRDQREHSISFRTKDDYQPKLPAEERPEVGSQVRGEYITALTFSPDGKVLVAAVHFHLKIYGEKEHLVHDEEQNILRRWQLASGKELHACSGHAMTISGIFFSADGKTLTTASEDGTVRFWDAARGKENRRCWKADGPLFCAAYSPDGKWFAAGSKKVVLVWDAGTEKLRLRLAMPAEEVRSLAFTPDSKRLIAGGG